MSRIATNFIRDRLIPAVNIEGFIGQYVTLKRQGSNYSCCCPFHHEKTPSFVVTPSKQMFYCFGCKEHGNAIDFIMKFKNLSFVEAVEEVAQYAGMTVEYEAGGSFEKNDSYNIYYELMDRCASYFTKCLELSPQAQEYFIKKRGLSRDTIVKARLGFAPDSWDYLQNIAKNADELKKLIELGMLVNNRNNGNTYAMFRGRVMIPIINGRGKVISFGGRTLGDDKPKYLNTAENPIFRKRYELFGLYEALQANRNRPDRIVIVEGYMDVIALRQYGCSYAVASLGTATTKEQMELMYRYSKQVVCCYDGDFAGRSAAWHALETVTAVLKDDREIRFAFLPSEHDPDSLVRSEGIGAFTRILDASLSYPEFLVKHISEKYDLSDPGKRTPFLNEVLYFIQKIPELTLKAVCITELAKKVALSEELLYDMLKNIKLNPRDLNEVNKAANDIGLKPGTSNLLTTPMRRLIAFVLQQPTIVATMYDRFSLDEFLPLCQRAQIKGIEDLAFYFNLIKERPDITPAGIIETVRGSRRENYVRNLIEAEFIPKKSDGSEFSMEVRAELLAKLLKETLLQQVERDFESLRQLGEDISEKQMAEVSQLNKILTKYKQK